LIEVLLERVEYLLEIASLGPVELQAGVSDRAVWQPDGQVFAIGEEELGNYQRALMLTVMDEEWRQYLNAIDDLRQGAGLAAVGQRDPKVEFKRRAFEMFEQLRLNTQEGIARRFFETLPRHRQIVESQKRQDELLDRLAQTGYRIQQRRRQGEDGQVRVSQTVTKDMWSNVGRNDPCPCGSGKKFKDCHYNQIRQQQAAATMPGGAPPPRQMPGGKRRRR
ncbi:MAG: preprotein translocase subunit SecA, partial [Anaerolineae bacterium]|nr:preprotein translocase subunit SecA [Anaerolineae bacterium]